MQSWLNSLMVAYIVRTERCTRQPRKVVGSSKVSPLASLGDAIISPSSPVIPCHALKRVAQFCRFLHRLSCLLFFGEIANPYTYAYNTHGMKEMHLLSFARIAIICLLYSSRNAIVFLAITKHGNCQLSYNNHRLVILIFC